MTKFWTLEDVYDSIGGFGRFQLLVVCTILFPVWPAGMMDLQPIFTGSHPVKWICKNGSASYDVTDDNVALCSCNGTLDGGNESIVSEWLLICDYAWVADFITSIQMMGMMTGDIIVSYLADRLGRKQPLYLSCLSLMLGSISSSFAGSLFTYAIARFFVGVGVSSILVLASYYPMEFLTPRWRCVSGSAAGPLGEGVMTLAILARYFRPWRQLCLATSVPMMIMFLTYPFLPESPRWLLMNGKVDEAQVVLNTIARINKREPVKETIVEKLAECVKVCEERNSQGGLSSVSFYGNIRFFRKTVIFMGCWFNVCLLYYGIGFNMKNLAGDPYWNVFYLGIGDVIGLRSAIFVSKWFGRKKSFAIYMSLAGVLMFSVVFIHAGMLEYNEFHINICTFVGKVFVAAAFAVLEWFTSESFPTAVRSKAVGFANVAGSFAGIIAPQMAFLGSMCQVGPYLIFSTVAVMSSCSTLFLKETIGKPLEENV
ncbi:unnamed protein product [Allacma fusca]|uniref:Major facilitator superfamily (MFS) profile domain-containing protein n=1 Tax=Allacma fusca TaxID=39272 RepID=A0A8J2KY92_9HEXA|nr:unnamed protein product [Allacma fusca]